MGSDFSTGIRKIGDALSAVISAEVTAGAQAKREAEGIVDSPTLELKI